MTPEFIASLSLEQLQAHLALLGYTCHVFAVTPTLATLRQMARTTSAGNRIALVSMEHERVVRDLPGFINSWQYGQVEPMPYEQGAIEVWRVMAPPQMRQYA